jgi:hypothetical protein
MVANAPPAARCIQILKMNQPMIGIKGSKLLVDRLMVLCFMASSAVHV